MNMLIAVPFGLVFVALTLIPLQLTQTKSIYFVFLIRNLEAFLYVGAAWFIVAAFTFRRIADTFFLGERGAKLQVAPASRSKQKDRR